LGGEKKSENIYVRHYSIHVYIYMAIYGYMAIYICHGHSAREEPLEIFLKGTGQKFISKKQKIQMGSLTWAENGNARDDDDDDDVPWYMKETLNP
jgi:hypothetical protein